jgi:hypothetical protein
MKVQGGVEVQLHVFVTYALDTDDQLHAKPALPLREKSPKQPLHRRLSGNQNLSGCSGKEDNLLDLPGTEPRILCRPACGTVSHSSFPRSVKQNEHAMQISLSPAESGSIVTNVSSRFIFLSIPILSHVFPCQKQGTSLYP